MTVKELIEQLIKHPQDAEVYYMGQDNGLICVSSVKELIPSNEETAEVCSSQMVIIE